MFYRDYLRRSCLNHQPPRAGGFKELLIGEDKKIRKAKNKDTTAKPKYNTINNRFIALFHFVELKKPRRFRWGFLFAGGSLVVHWWFAGGYS